MQRNDKAILPVLLGGDLNAYSVALAFKERYGVKSHAFVRYKCGATENSSFIKTHICSGLDDVRIAVPELLKFASENSGAELYLIPCADWYVAMLEEARNALSGIYNIHIPEREMWRMLSDKSDFYRLISKERIPYPETCVFSYAEAITEKKLEKITFPAVLKPTDSTEYWKNPFSDMRKVYFPKNVGEAIGLVYKIFESGYKKRVVVQNNVGRNAKNKVLTTFSDSNGRVVRAVLGEVILEECGKTSYGNHCAIVTVGLDEISKKLIRFLNKIKYRGIANIDMMSNESETYALEINTRQGRSCDYLRSAGVNIAELLVMTARGERIEESFSYKKIYWHYPSHKSVMRYSSDKEIRTLANHLYKLKEDFSPYCNAFEGMYRKLYVKIHNMRLDSALKRGYLENR